MELKDCDGRCLYCKWCSNDTCKQTGEQARNHEELALAVNPITVYPHIVLEEEAVKRTFVKNPDMILVPKTQRGSFRGTGLLLDHKHEAYMDFPVESWDHSWKRSTKVQKQYARHNKHVGWVKDASKLAFYPFV